jgi:hypothetical protein
VKGQSPFLMLWVLHTRVVIALIMLMGVGWSSSQYLPAELIPTKSIHLLAFVDEHCVICGDIHLESASITFVGRSSTSPFAPYIRDLHDLLSRTFQIEVAPTFVLLHDGKEVMRSIGSVESLEQYWLQSETNIPEPRFEVRIKLGQVVPEEFAALSGFIVFWHEDCAWCQRVAVTLKELCHGNKKRVYIVSVHGEWPEPCKGEYISDALALFGLPGTPAHAFIRNGMLKWLDIGYRGDLREMLHALEIIYGGR